MLNMYYYYTGSCKLATNILVAGKPRAPRIDGRVEVVGGGQFRISWRTDSYARIEQYRLLYRKAPVSNT